MKILYFIESLRCGGKERRLLELIRYLTVHTNHEILLVLTESEIHYKFVHDLGIELIILKRKWIKKDPSLFYKFYRLTNEFKPDIIHTWGSMLSFYALPVIIHKNIPHINGHIADAPLVRPFFGFYRMIESVGFRYSDVIVSNSLAGLASYGVSGHKSKVIYNGVRLDRFENLLEIDDVKSRFKIKTRYTIIMLASYTKHKNYDQFLDVAELLSCQRNDITFLGVGDTEKDSDEYDRIRKRAEGIVNVILSDKITEVESLINACDIGVLFTYSEGISNSIIEYMVCGKPSIVNDVGGSREIIANNETGFLLTNETTHEIADLINKLIDNEVKRSLIGRNARLHIENRFSIDRMGSEFAKLYEETAKPGAY